MSMTRQLEKLKFWAKREQFWATKIADCTQLIKDARTPEERKYNQLYRARCKVRHDEAVSTCERIQTDILITVDFKTVQ